MAGSNFVLDKSWIPTAAVRKFRAVVASTSNKDNIAEASSAGVRIRGICQEEITTGDVALGRVADIRVMGVSRCIAGAAVAIDDPLVTDNQGRVVPAAAATANQNQVGIAWTAAAAAGDHIEVMLTPAVRITIA